MIYIKRYQYLHVIQVTPGEICFKEKNFHEKKMPRNNLSFRSGIHEMLPIINLNRLK